MKKLKPEDIESVNVLNGSGAKVIYGNEGSYGAIIISSKKREE